MATVTQINGVNVPVTVMNGYEMIGVFVSADEVLADNLFARFDLFVQSWDGVYAVHSMDAHYRAIVGGSDGGHTVYLHAKRQLMAFRKVVMP